MATFIPNVTDIFPEPALFTPDFSFMDKMLQRRQSMYDQGWSQVNAAYNYVNKELTNPNNIKERDIFLKQAKNNLKNLSGVDLSQHQNVMAARNVFEPWANNTKALGDASLTAHWKQQEAIGEGYRLEDGGKYFNDFNINYVKKQRAAFANDAAESWEDYWKGKRSYTPYYDYHKEIQDLMKDFKPSSYEIDKVNGLYKYTDKNASWRNSEIRKYLEANLSDKAKQQMKIEADVTYNNDPKVLGQMYIGISKNEIEQYDNGIALANKQLKSETNADKVKNLRNYISNLEDRKKVLSTNIDNINKGDFSYIKKKGEDLSMSIFFNQFMNKVSNGWSHDEVVHKIDGDEVGLAVFKEAKEDERQQKGFAHAEKLARMKGEIAPPAQQTQVQIETPEATDLKSIQKKATELDAQNENLNNINKGMVATWMQSLPENKGKVITVKDVGTDEMLRYKREGFNGKPLPSEHAFLVNERQANQNQSIKNHVLNSLRAAEEEVKKNLTSDQLNKIQAAEKQVDQIGEIVLDDGKKITGRQLFDGIKNGTINLSGGNLFSSGGDNFSIRIGGKTYDAFSKLQGRTDKVISKNTNLLSALNVIDRINESDAYEKYQDQVKDYFKRNRADLTHTAANVMSFAKGSAEAKSLESEMYNVFPEAQYSIQTAGIGTDAYNQGSAYFYITSKGDTNASADDITTYLKQRGYGENNVIAHEQKGTGVTLYEIKNFKSPITQTYSQFNPQEIAVLQDLSTERMVGTGGKYQSQPYQSYSNRNLMVMKDHGLYHLLVQGLNGGNTMDAYPQPFNDPTQAMLMGQQLTQPVNGVSEAMLNQYQKLLNQ